MATGADMARSDDRLGDGAASGAGTIRARNRGLAVERPDGSVGIVPLVETNSVGGMEVANSPPRPQKWQPGDSVYIRLARAQDDVKTITQDADIEIKKDGKTVGKYKGVTAAQIVTFAKSALIANGIVFLPRQTKEGISVSGNMTSLYVNAIFACVDSDSAFETGGWGAGTDFNDKAISKAYTNAVKNILAKTLMMSTLEDESDEATPHEPDHKPAAVKNAEALSDVAIKTWADAFNSALNGCQSLKQLKQIRTENTNMMNHPGVPAITKEYFVDKISGLEGTLQ